MTVDRGESPPGRLRLSDEYIETLYRKWYPRTKITASVFVFAHAIADPLLAEIAELQEKAAKTDEVIEWATEGAEQIIAERDSLRVKVAELEKRCVDVGAAYARLEDEPDAQTLRQQVADAQAARDLAVKLCREAQDLTWAALKGKESMQKEAARYREALDVARRVLAAVTDEEWVPINSSIAGACGVALDAIDAATSMKEST